MTRNKKLILAGTIAGLLGTVAIVGAVQADPPGGYGPGYGSYGPMMGGYGPGQHMMGGYGPWGGDHMWGGGPGPRGGYHMWGGDRGFRGGPGFGGGPILGQIFEDADTDKDGKLTQAEVDAYRDGRFAEFDADKDGKLNLDEFTALHNDLTRQWTVRAFQMHDPDGDGTITKEEFDRPTAGLVERLDRDDDGALSRVDRHHRAWGWGPMHRFYDDDDKDTN